MEVYTNIFVLCNMTLDSITIIPNGIRAILYEQYENIKVLLPIFADNLVMRCEHNHMGKVKKISYFPEPQKVIMNMGELKITQIKPEKGQMLKIDKLLEDGEIPSSVLCSIELNKMPISVYVFSLNGIDEEITLTIDISNQEDYKASMIVDLQSDECSDELQYKLNTVIGFIQHIITLSVSTFLAESFCSAYINTSKNQIRKKKISLKKTKPI